MLCRKLFFLLLFFFLQGIFLFITPSDTHANHFRAGTMSWAAVDGEDRTVLIKMQIGWTNNHSHIPSATPIGGVVTNKLTLFFGDGQSISGALRVVSRNTTTNDVQTELVSIKSGDDDYTEGVLHTYAADGDYTAYWQGSARENAENLDSGTWKNETLINIGGEHDGNSSPVTAVAAVVQVPDNQEFTYKLVGVDSDGDDVQFRYGTKAEFFAGADEEATKPTGLVIDTEGNITWDVTDGTLATDIGDRWQMTVMAEDLDSEGDVKSYVPLDFVFKISDASDLPPTITTADDSLSVVEEDTISFSLTAEDPDWEAGDDSPEMSVINPPSGNSSIWSTSSSSSDEETTFDVTFTPNAGMDGNTYVVIFQATDDAGNASTKNVSITVNAEPSPTPTPISQPQQSQPSDTSADPPVCNDKRAQAPDLFQIDATVTTATLYFVPLSEYDTYYISYSTSSDAEEHSTLHTKDSDANQVVTINDLLPNSAYYFKIRVQNDCMPGEWSEIKASGTTVETPVYDITSSPLTVTEMSVESLPSSTCTYTVEPGDTLWDLAQETLGDGSQYQEIIDLNQEAFPDISEVLTVGWTLTFPCESQSESVPHTHDEEGNTITYDNVVTVTVEDQGKPLEGVEVELHSDPKSGLTDKDGKVTFTDVEPGEHSLVLAYNDFTAQQRLVVDENEDEYNVKVTVEMKQQFWLQSWFLLILGSVLGICLVWLLMFLKRRKRKNTEEMG